MSDDSPKASVVRYAFSRRWSIVVGIVADAFLIAVLIAANAAVAWEAEHLKQQGLDAILVTTLQVILGLATVILVLAMVVPDVVAAVRVATRKVKNGE